MSQEHFRPYIAVGLILRKGDEVLFMRRINTGYRDGQYTLPAGHVEADEFPIQTVVREAKEEMGIEVAPEDVTFAHMNYRIRPDRTYVDLYFNVTKWSGEPQANEPEKSDSVKWFSVQVIPDEVSDYLKDVLASTASGQVYSELRQF